MGFPIEAARWLWICFFATSSWHAPQNISFQTTTSSDRDCLELPQSSTCTPLWSKWHSRNCSSAVSKRLPPRRGVYLGTCMMECRSSRSIVDEVTWDYVAFQQALHRHFVEKRTRSCDAALQAMIRATIWNFRLRRVWKLAKGIAILAAALVCVGATVA